MKRILITGANSYIGTSVEKYLSQWPEDYRVDTIDLVDGSWREKSFVGYNVVFHVAGIAHISTKGFDQAARERYWAVNALLPREVAAKAKMSSVEQFIFLSSMSVYGEIGRLNGEVVINKQTIPSPKDIYGKSKLAAEEGLFGLQSENFFVCVLRPPIIYGPGCKGNYQTLSSVARKAPIFPEVLNHRSMLFVGNLGSIIKSKIDSKATGVHLPQNAEYVCTSDIVRKIAAISGNDVRFVRFINPFLRFTSRFSSSICKVFGNLVYERDTDNVSSAYTFEESLAITEEPNRE